MTENERLSLLGLFPVPSIGDFTAADVQQMLIYSTPLVEYMEMQLPDTNIIYLDLEVIADAINISVDITAEEIIKEFIVHANTKPR